MTNWQACKYDTLIALQNESAKNIMWCSTATITPRHGSSTITHNKGKGLAPAPSYNRPQGNNFGESNHDSYGNFGCIGNRRVFGNKGPWGHPKDAKAYFKFSSKPYIHDTSVKRERSTL